MPENTIFRQKALQSYRRNMEKDVLPHFISWPLIMCLWVLLTLPFIVGWFAWNAQVPTSVGGSGVILARGTMLHPADPNMVAIIFLSPTQAATIRIGLPVDLQIGSEETHLHTTIAQIEPEIIGPEAAQQRYQLTGAGAQLITQPSRVAILKLGTTLPLTTYAGSVFTATITTGSQRLLLFLIGGQLLGNGS